MVTVGPLLSHCAWNVVLLQPSTDARQQCVQYELLRTTGFNQLVKTVRKLMFFSKIADFAKPTANNNTMYCYTQSIQ